MDNSDGFLDWFAGFVDGEGCFQIRNTARPSRPKSFEPTLAISMREDDGALLLEIKRRLGFGCVFFYNPGGRTGTRPAVRLTFNGRHQAERLLAIFEAHSLRSKKRRDFEVWAAAVREKAKGKAADRGLLRQLEAQIKEVRQYVPREAAPPSGDKQLRLVERVS